MRHLLLLLFFFFAWFSFAAAIPVEAIDAVTPAGLVDVAVVSSPLTVYFHTTYLLSVTDTGSWPSSNPVVDPNLRAETESSGIASLSMPSPGVASHVAIAVPLDDDTGLYTGTVDVLYTADAVQTRAMPITEPIIGEIVGAFVLFVLVNVALICLGCRCFCPRRGQAGNDSESDPPATSRGRAVNLTVAGRVPQPRRKDLPRASRSVSEDSRGRKSNDRSTSVDGSESAAHVGSLEMLPYAMTLPARPLPSHH